MATSRPFAYNTGTGITGTTQIGSLAVGYPTEGFTSTGLEWWCGPDEDLGYVIAQSVPSDAQPTPVPDDALALSPTYKGPNINLSNNNQTASQQFGYQMSVLAETLISGSDKVMFSIRSTSLEPLTLPQSRFIGVGKTTMNYQGDPYGGYPGNDNKSIGFNAIGEYYYNGSVVSSGLPTWTQGDIIDIAISHGQYWWIRVNGGDWNNSNTANPSTLSGGLTMNGLSDYYPALCPGYEGTMDVLYYPKYGVPSLFDFLGNVSASVGFYRTGDFNDETFIGLAQTVSKEGGTPQTFASATGASSWLTTNGYWNSYTYPVLSLDAAGYSSGNWIDSIGGKNFVLQGSPSWSSSNGGYFNFDATLDQFAECSTNLPDLNTWTIGVWHYYNGTNTGSAPCIVTEVYPGITSQINYSLGNNNGDLSSGFFNGSWVTTGSSSNLLSPNNWYYIVGSWDGSAIKLYVNGSLVLGGGGLSGNPISSQGGIRLMRRWDLGDYWGGRLAKVDIYNKSLNSSQINSIWNATKSRFDL
jgi:hypothetical protein